MPSWAPLLELCSQPSNHEALLLTVDCRADVSACATQLLETLRFCVTRQMHRLCWTVNHCLRVSLKLFDIRHYLVLSLPNVHHSFGTLVPKLVGKHL